MNKGNDENKLPEKIIKAHDKESKDSSMEGNLR